MSIRRIPSPDEVVVTERGRVQPWLDPYTYHVVSLLVGPMGLNRDEVVRSMIRDWIREHHDEVEKMGIQPLKVRDNGLIVSHESERDEAEAS